VIALVALVVLLPLAGVVAVAARCRAQGAGYALVAGAIGSFAASIALAAAATGRPHVQGIGGFLYVDPLAVFFAITVSLVVVLAAFGSAAYMRVEEDRGELSSFQVRLYFVFFSVFASGMLGSLFAGNLGLLWVLIEASTLASAALVGLEAKARSLEAAWKYVIISSLGVTIALLATLWLFYAGSALHLTSSERLTWPYLFLHAHALQPGSLRLAFLLAVVGYGTKVGLAPMHTWLPDAHSEAPSPASAMLSAALLNTGMYAVIRFQAIAKAGLGNAYPDHVLLVFGFLTLFVGVIFMVRRGNFKRLFATPPSSTWASSPWRSASAAFSASTAPCCRCSTMPSEKRSSSCRRATSSSVTRLASPQKSAARSARYRSQVASSCSPRSQSRAVRPLGCSSPSSRSSVPASQERLLSWPGSFSSYSSSASSPSSARPWPWQLAMARSRFILILAALAGSSPRSRSSAGLAFSFSSVCGSRAD
jgi:hypothetical protein